MSVEGRAPVRRVTAPCVLRVKVSKDCIIPAHSEITVHSQLEGPPLKYCALVNSVNENVCDKIIVGKCIVQRDKKCLPGAHYELFRKILLCLPVNTSVRSKK